MNPSKAAVFPRFERATVLLSLSLVRLPALAPARLEALVAALFLAPLILVILYRLTSLLMGRRMALEHQPGRLALFAAFVVVLFISLGLFGLAAGLRPFLSQFVLWGVVVAFFFLVFACAPPARRPRLLWALAGSVVIYVCLNFALFVAGVQSPEAVNRGSAVMLGQLGLQVDRVRFPLAAGFNGFGGVAAAAMAASLATAAKRDLSRKWRAVHLAAGGVSLLCVLLVDNRAALLIGFGLVGMALLFRRLTSRAVALLPLAVAALTLGTIAAGGISTDLAGASIERKPGELGTLNGRVYIWEVVARELATPQAPHLLGFGFRGQVASGLSDAYSPFLADPRLEPTVGSWPAHNTLLQAVIDTGYFGALVLLAVVTLVLLDFGRSPMPSSFYLTLVLAAFVLESFLEIQLSPQSPDSFLVVVGIACAWATGAHRSWRRQATMNHPEATSHGA